MRKKWQEKALTLIVTSVVAFACSNVYAINVADYQRAEKMLPANIQKLVRNINPAVAWFDDGSGFWYSEQTDDGVIYNAFDMKTGEHSRAFDHEKLSKSLETLLQRKFQAKHLSFSQLTLNRQQNSFSFRHWGKGMVTCKLGNLSCRLISRHSSLSPDDKWTVLVKADHNLYIKNNQTGSEKRLTHDANKNLIYGTWMPAADVMVSQGKEDVLRSIDIHWAPDSSRFLAYRLDMRKAKTLTLVQSVHDEGMRPKAYTYPYALPGDTELTFAEPVIFEIRRGGAKRVEVKVPKIPMRYDDDGVDFKWSDDSRSIYYIEYGRGNNVAWLRHINAINGKARVLFTAKSDTFVTPGNSRFKFINSGQHFILSSERDGWHHLYLHDGKTGKIKHQITKGDFYVRYIIDFDESKQQLYFMANGLEKGDPYYRYLYRIDLTGENLTLLTPELGHHSIALSPDFRYVVDRYSTPQKPTETVVSSTENGKVLYKVLSANIDKLKVAGWKPPEPFAAKAEDGKTVIYGIVYRPTNFSHRKKYPVIESIYTGPGDFNVPKSFSWSLYNTTQSIAELGFIVVMVDGRGTGMRDKSFHHVARKKLGAFLGDHIAAIKQLAKRYPYMDTNRVGVYGYSAGGYDAARAMFLYPEFYKVGVSASGNHDHRLDKADWNEKWMGFPVDESYKAQSNLEIAGRLQGKLMLAVGELDHNVPPAATIQLIDRLIKANKDFDFLLIPNKKHYFENDPYYTRRRWDFFVRHLLNKEPPAYQVGHN